MSPLNITQPLDSIRYMVYNGYYNVMSNSPQMGHLPIPVIDLCVQVLWAVFQKDILWTCVWTRNRHTKMYAHALMNLHTTFLLLLFMPVHLHHDFQKQEISAHYLPY